MCSSTALDLDDTILRGLTCSCHTLVNCRRNWTCVASSWRSRFSAAVVLCSTRGLVQRYACVVGIQTCEYGYAVFQFKSSTGDRRWRDATAAERFEGR